MKKLIGSDIGGYVFDPSARTISVVGCPAFNLENVLLIMNRTAGVMLYNFAEAGLGGSVNNNIITLAIDTTSQSASDALQIWIDLPTATDISAEQAGLDPSYVTDTNLMQVLGSRPIVAGESVQTNTRLRRFTPVVSNLTRANSEARIDCEGANSVAIQISGTWAGTLTFQASINGADFGTIHAVPISGGYGTNSTTASNLYAINSAGVRWVRVVFTTYTSGTAQVVLIADAASPTNVIFPPSQVTADSQIPTIFGATSLYSPAITEAVQPVINPVVAPSQPTSYADPKFASYPQKYRRLRVQSGGDGDLPFAQHPVNRRMLVDFPEMYAKIEELLMQQTLTNQLLAQAFNLALPSGMTSELK